MPRIARHHPRRLGARQSHQVDFRRRGALWTHLGRASVLGASKPLCPTCQTMLTHECTHAPGAVDTCAGELCCLIACQSPFVDAAALR